jgi:hypothetical protein
MLQMNTRRSTLEIAAGDHPARCRGDPPSVADAHLQMAMFMRVRFLMFVCTAAVMPAEAQMADPSAVFTYQQSPVLNGNLRAVEPAPFWEQFNVEFDNRAAGEFEDQFYPLNFSNWNALWTDHDFNYLSNYNAAEGRHAFSDTFRSSAQAAVLESDLPGLEWLRERQGFLADFLWNSLDNVDEQSVSPLDPSYRSDERSWWYEQSEGGPLRYGLRPFSTDPYAYLSWRIKDGERVWLLGDARYYYQNFDEHRIELALSTPIERGFSVELGTSYQFGTQPAERKLVLKLVKTFKSDGILYVALAARQQPESPGLIAAITLPW